MAALRQSPMVAWSTQISTQLFFVCCLLATSSSQPPAGLTFSSGLVNAPPQNATATCNAQVQDTALRQLYSITGGPNWNNSSQWFSTAQCNQTAPNGMVLQVPSYCCWTGVSCCLQRVCNGSDTRIYCDCANIGMVTRLALPRNNLTGPLPNNLLAWLACELKVVDFSFNNLAGTIDSNISLLSNLRSLALSNNNFSGPLPGALSRLKRLQVLDFTSNSLSGTIPSDLCAYENVTGLTDLLLANNNFTGQLYIPGCNNLVALDVTRNMLGGVIPDFRGYDMLHIARLGRNNFTGAVPLQTESAPLLMDLDVSGNMLNGTIPARLANLTLLSYIRLNGNNLTGTIPANLFISLANLVRMNLADNHLYGTLPEANTNLGTLVLMELSNNSLIGTIPESWAPFTEAATNVNLQRNLLSCCGIDPVNGSAALNYNYSWEAYSGYNATKAKNPNLLLPSFLTFSSYTVPVPPGRDGLASNMRCPDVVAKSRQGQSQILNWNIDPSYFLFYKCECPSSYELVNVAVEGRLPHYVCQPVSAAWYTYAWVVAVMVVGGVLVILACLFFTMYRKGAKPAFMHQLEVMRKRLKGEPKEGMVSIVTTDIEGYSELMKREPELMGKGLRIHNFCIDKARWQFVGYTMEQEGDSFIIAFQDPFDAVAFCLQAQLLLQRVEWPEKLMNPGGGLERAKKGSILSQALQGVKTILLREKTERSSNLDTITSFEKRSGSQSQSQNVSGTSEEQFRQRTEEAMTASGGSNKKGAGSYRLGMPIPEEHAVSSGPSNVTETERKTTDDSRTHSSSLYGDQTGGHSPDARGYSSLTFGPLGSTTGEQQLTSTESTGIRIHSTQVTGSSELRLAVFNGLRVRMGIATGTLEKGKSLRSSPIMERSKVVSDAAAGGQVLMDGATFQKIKDRLVELGAVDHNGLSLAKMNLSKPTLMAAMCGCGRRTRRDETEIALVLDMGQYVPDKSGKGSKIFCVPSNPGIAPSHGHEPTKESKEATPFQSNAAQNKGLDDAAAAALATVDGPLANHVDASAQRLHLYQIVSPVLVERARCFGSKLALKEADWICVDPPYFSAPGAAAAALGLDTSSSIPPITMVFCMVDGAKDWKPLSDKVKRQVVQRIMKDVLINTLVAVKGSYLCRLQEDEFKYMVAFPEPEDAAKWCLLVQDALMWQDWPDWLLKQDRAREELDETGNIVFRGPRLRMGMCHGCPRAIVPDHMGRADYHGASINSAARYMDAAAHGGQIVCEEETALSIVAIWNGVNPHRGSRFTPPQPHDPRAQALPLTAALSSNPLPPFPPEALPPSITEITPSSVPQVEGAGSGTAVHVSAVAGPIAGSMDLPTSSPTVSGTLPQVPLVLEGSMRVVTGATAVPGTATSATLPTVRISSSGPDAQDPTHSSGTPVLVVSAAEDSLSGSPRSAMDTSPTMAAMTTQSVEHKTASESYSVDNMLATGDPPSDGSEGPLATLTTIRPDAERSVARSATLRSATTPGALESPTSDNAQVEAPGAPVSFPAPSSPDKQPSSPSGRRSTGNLPTLRPASPTARAASVMGFLGNASPRRSSNLSVTTTAWDPEPTGKRPADTRSRSPSPPVLAGASASELSATGRTGAPQGILKKNLAGNAGEVVLPKPPKTGVVRIAAPVSQDGRGSGTSATTANTAATGGASATSRITPCTVPYNMLSALTYCASVSVIRLGAYRYKGSPDDVQMVHMLLENHLGRRFPPEPPKGKGERVYLSEGLAGFARNVELPNVARRYYWAWRCRNEDTAQPPTPRSTGTSRGWASLMSRNHSAKRRSDDPVQSRGDRPSNRSQVSQPGTGRHTLSDVLGRSRTQLTSLLRMSSRRASRTEGGVLPTVSTNGSAPELGPLRPSAAQTGSAPASVGRPSTSSVGPADAGLHDDLVLTLAESAPPDTLESSPSLGIELTAQGGAVQGGDSLPLPPEGPARV